MRTTTKRRRRRCTQLSFTSIVILARYLLPLRRPAAVIRGAAARTLPLPVSSSSCRAPPRGFFTAATVAPGAVAGMAPTLRSRTVTCRRPPLQRTTAAVATASFASTELSSSAGMQGRRRRRRRSRRQLEDDDDDPGNSDPLAVDAELSLTNDKKKTTRKRRSSKSEPKSDVVSSELAGGTQEEDEDPRLLFSLTENGADGSSQLVLGTLVCRPSSRNKSPYVADVYVPSLDRQAICHVPNLDMGGKCRPGVVVLMRHAVDSKGQIVGPDAVSPNYGTPKCEFIVQLLWVDESNFATESHDASAMYYPPVWVGAHPSLGERIAKAWIDRNLLRLPNREGHESIITRVQSQVTIPEVPNRRFDFMITYQDGTQRIVEVKTVVDCDYSVMAPPPTDLIKCRYFGNKPEGDYRRTAIFPWGTRKQKGGTDNKTLVVSARAIHHVDELRRLVVERQQTNYRATILFVVVRGDAVAFRPNHEACPEFVKSLRRAHDAGVDVVAKRVHFGMPGIAAAAPLSTTTSGATATDPSYATIMHPENCYSDIDLPILWPDDDHDDDDDDTGVGSTIMP